jgi:hypothetical protein
MIWIFIAVKTSYLHKQCMLQKATSIPLTYESTILKWTDFPLTVCQEGTPKNNSTCLLPFLPPWRRVVMGLVKSKRVALSIKPFVLLATSRQTGRRKRAFNKLYRILVLPRETVELILSEKCNNLYPERKRGWMQIVLCMKPSMFS